ncbi:DUF4169 family protein [Stappia sp. MMSF_3263]|uniref:DUF4169 family protein n=1 Tax=Stappia sp. MMSF_3263 TaxID=3046693 RepID=UPI00273DBFBC|nr:DUF4169 family protein [Stappia sp. MMSF_3263]
MTGDIVNLRQARKARARREKETRAAENRVQFGRSKSEKNLTRTTVEKSAAHVDAHKREHPQAGPKPRGDGTAGDAGKTDEPDRS